MKIIITITIKINKLNSEKNDETNIDRRTKSTLNYYKTNKEHTNSTQRRVVGMFKYLGTVI